MRSQALLLYFTVLQTAGAAFPEDTEPISISHSNCEDHIYTVDIETANAEEIFFSKKLTWKSRQADVDTCRMKGKHKDECHNFIKVLLQQSDDSLFVCGTNAFNPSCRTYKVRPLTSDLSRAARLTSKQLNESVAENNRISVANFIKYETNSVVFPRVARVCKNDRGGSQRVLEKQWTSFLKTRLNCSIPGDSHFYFNILQAVTDVIHISGHDVVMATFSTPYNSIPGSAVCAYDMAEISAAFTGRFKEQKSPDSTWTPVPEEKVPRPRPGVCAGSSSGEKFKVSNEFPDETLNFIKLHPLMDEAVPSIANRPWFLKTMVRYRLTRIAVDNAAGPHRNHTVVFLGSERGIVLKFLAKMRSGFLNDSLFLEELSVYNPEKCVFRSVIHTRLSGYSARHLLTVCVRVCVCVCVCVCACVCVCVCARRWPFEQDVEQGNTDGLGDCQNVDVCCAPAGLLTTVPPPAPGGPLLRGRMVKPKEAEPPGDQSDPYVSAPSDTQQESAGVIRETYHRDRDQMVPVTLLAIAVILAFVMGGIFSGIVVYCVCDHHRRRDFELPGRKDKDSVQSRRGSMNSVTKLTGLFETQAKDGRTEAILTPLMHNGRLANGKMLIKADQHLDLTALPTPESTPMQPRRKPSRGSREWERNQNLINACTKDLPSMGSVVIPTDLPLRASPGHIPSVVVLPLPQHQHEYVEQPHRGELAIDQAATLEYKSLKSPSLANGERAPPRVPQREASLSAVIPPAVPQMGKRLDVHSSVYSRGYPMSSGIKKQHNTNSSNSSHMSRNHSFRVETPPPPAPQRVDSMHVTSPPPILGLSRHPSLSSYGSLSRHLKPDVPPKPNLVSLSTKAKSGDSCT
uniref:Sema domain-containing protein n=1 Tax=Sinocyclocheilus grahami TaxID=75366 RepID=A0A672MFG0_SINGR